MTTHTMNTFAEVACTSNRSSAKRPPFARTIRAHWADLVLFGLVAVVAICALALPCLHPSTSASVDAVTIVTGL